MSSLYWHTTGTGDRDLVLLHGWGLNAEVWQHIVPRLSPHFRLHLVDLPGFGRSRGFGPLSLAQMAQQLLPQLPARAVLLGWSLGGLVASQLALSQPDRVAALISVASSPCFTARDEWPGIQPETLATFQQQLSSDFQRTVERFLALQTMGTENARQDARQLKEVVLSQPMPSVAVLEGGLNILRHEDLRSALDGLTLPFLRIYGALDGLVPRRIAPQLDARWPYSQSVVIAKAAHAPFISHPEAFCQQVQQFIHAAT
ncbi:carboxylesterase [Pantoea dispersa]|uniref:pimeloyl-ACP methyl ester esterase BioH n=1 Tax=Pantoea dispersa TaxID=59814 RepID=UPI0007369FF0|nr:pimeloyl-ACP methyl ester esterase BioH [Pantoea dispersa]KTS16057.1 carboxylesterase [Pantoea dispersa]KTS87151.1 carboxylesterase [Pantoea dispersa]